MPSTLPLVPYFHATFLVQSNVRICIGEAMELFLIHGRENLLIDGRETNTLSGKYSIEILRIQRMFLITKVTQVKTDAFLNII